MVKSIEPVDRSKFFGDNDDESDEIFDEGGGDGEEVDSGYRLEFDDDNEMLVSSTGNGGGGGVDSWNEVKLTELVNDGELERYFCVKENFFRRA